MLQDELGKILKDRDMKVYIQFVLQSYLQLKWTQFNVLKPAEPGVQWHCYYIDFASLLSQLSNQMLRLKRSEEGEKCRNRFFSRTKKQIGAWTKIVVIPEEREREADINRRMNRRENWFWRTSKREYQREIKLKAVGRCMGERERNKWLEKKTRKRGESCNL